MKSSPTSFGSVDRWEDEGGALRLLSPLDFHTRQLLAAATIKLWGSSLPMRTRKRLLKGSGKNRHLGTAALRQAIAHQLRGRRLDK